MRTPDFGDVEERERSHFSVFGFWLHLYLLQARPHLSLLPWQN